MREPENLAILDLIFHCAIRSEYDGNGKWPKVATVFSKRLRVVQLRHQTQILTPGSAIISQISYCLNTHLN